MGKKRWVLAAIGIVLMGAVGIGCMLGMTARDSDGSFVFRNPFSKQVDVVVIGTELEGMYLARRAKQEGLKVLILEPRSRLGGQLLQGEMLYLDGVYNDQGDSLVQGGMKELFHLYEEGQVRNKAQFAAYFHRLVQGIPLEKGVSLEDVVVTDGKVTALQYGKDGKQDWVYPTYVVDNSDQAALLRKLNLQPLPGLESLYGTGTGNREFMSATYMMKFKGVDWHTFYSRFWKLDKMERSSLYGPDTYVDSNIAYGFPPIVGKYKLQHPDMLNLRGLNILNQGNGEVIINALQVYDVDPSRPETVERGKQAAREEMPSILAHLRKHLAGYENAELNGEPQELYIREYYHYPTEYVLQASDLMSGRMFWDNVSIGGYFMDIQGSRSNREGFAIGKPDQYGMPLRSYLIRGYDNVITAGKMVGSTVVAYGSTRIQPNGALAAESIGVLLGRMKGRSLKTVTKAEMTAFQADLNKKYRIQVAPVEAKNKISHLTEEQKKQLDEGKLTLLGEGVAARHLPFMQVSLNGTEVRYTGGLKPLAIEDRPWAPLQETFRLLGAVQVRYDVDSKRVTYSLAQNPQVEYATWLPVHVLNNFALVDMGEAAKLLGYRLDWDSARMVAKLERASDEL
ncbi:FAD-dependent oxidoreductase [Paenibacillus cremeus]|uniref:FAD-dependent oxidoreductase n=1 Tax=Paenibacillus cremeus TaxID=2163881 RepID=A0A559KB34_9BACL|nr:FAD-dependent oxidoreductase [Paenibacillus cremeus]TVY09346.1 FAD-dependent oxidoreductase [Paenibacillus cremeus]